MKFSAFAAALVILGTSSLHAGSFGGPGPFRNDSPLATGIDGTYQAAARATNATGLIRFGIQTGVQSGGPQLNQWIFFAEGTIFRGNTAVVVSEGNITGILDSDDLQLPVGDDGSISLPAVFVVRGTRASGEFSGTIELKNPNGLFYGDGRLIPTPSEEIQIITITDDPGILDPVTVTPVLLGGSTGNEIAFDFRGVRSSTTIVGEATDFSSNGAN